MSWEIIRTKTDNSSIEVLDSILSSFFKHFALTLSLSHYFAQALYPEDRLVYHLSVHVSLLAVTPFLLTLSSFFNNLSRSSSSLSNLLWIPLPADFCPQPSLKTAIIKDILKLTRFITQSPLKKINQILYYWPLQRDNKKPGKKKKDSYCQIQCRFFLFFRFLIILFHLWYYWWLSPSVILLSPLWALLFSFLLCVFPIVQWLSKVSTVSSPHRFSICNILRWWNLHF